MLNDDEASKVRLLLAGSGWNDVVRPRIAVRAKEALRALILSPSERRGTEGDFKDADDETLRGIIRECEWMLTSWHNEVVTYDQNRRLDELDREERGAGSPVVPIPANP